jgi:hypothetical protein
LSHEQLPQILELELQPLDHQYAAANRLIGLTITVFLALIGCILYFQPFLNLDKGIHRAIPYITICIVTFSMLLTWYKYASDKHKFYTLRELDIHYISGLIFRKIVSQPITRIQHVEIKRGPIERKLGLASLQVFSAGGDMHTFEIPGLPTHSAKKIRQFILQHKDMLKHG